MTVSESENGKTIRIAQGDDVVLVLHSTYWQIQGSSNAKVLKPTGNATAAGPGHPCSPPGSGCGTVTEKFVALATGSAQLRASRTSCGEALQCSPSPQRYDVTVQVS